VRSVRKMPPIPSVSAIRLPQPVARRDLEVAERGLVPPDLHHVEHEVGAVECGAPVEVRADSRARAPCSRDVACHRLCGLQPIGVDVVECDLHLAQGGEVEDVAEQVLREDDATRAD